MPLSVNNQLDYWQYGINLNIKPINLLVFCVFISAPSWQTYPNLKAINYPHVYYVFKVDSLRKYAGKYKVFLARKTLKEEKNICSFKTLCNIFLAPYYSTDPREHI